MEICYQQWWILSKLSFLKIELDPNLKAYLWNLIEYKQYVMGVTVRKISGPVPMDC